MLSREVWSREESSVGRPCLGLQPGAAIYHVTLVSVRKHAWSLTHFPDAEHVKGETSIKE